MADLDVDEKLIRWNDIFAELAVDARTLVKDLSEGINYVAVSAFIVILIGVAALIIGFDQGSAKYAAAGFLIFGISAFNGAMGLRKWYRLRLRYNRLRSLGKGLETS